MAAKYDVIVVPGFGGSTLSYAGGRGGKTPLWYNPTAILKSTPLALGLANDGVSPWPIIGKTLFPDGPVDFGIYEPLVTALANGGFNPVFWAYDWRLDANRLASQLTAYLQSGVVKSSFAVVAHSYGGLVAQLAYQLYAAAGPGPTWTKTAYLATPQGGSHWAAAALGGLFYDGSELAMFSTLFNLGIQIQPAIKQIFAGLEGVIGQLVGSWPGLYCLLPNPYTPWAALDANAAKCLQLATYAQTPGGQQQQWLTLANTILQTLATNWTKPRPTEFVILGGDRKTLATLEDVKHPGALGSYSTSLDGDGTVLTARAMDPPANGRQFKRTGHNDVCYSAAPVANLVELLKAPPTDYEVLANAVPHVTGPTQSFTIDFPPVIAQPFINKYLDP